MISKDTILVDIFFVCHLFKDYEAEQKQHHTDRLMIKDLNI